MLRDTHDARILIVDDQASNLRLLELALRRGGYSAVTSTSDPREAQPLHLQNNFELILLDLQMPMMNGFEVMKALRAMDVAAGVAILVMSADPAQLVPSLEGGANSFLSKPVVLGDVLARVESMLAPRAQKTGELDASTPTHRS